MSAVVPEFIELPSPASQSGVCLCVCLCVGFLQARDARARQPSLFLGFEVYIGRLIE